MAQILSRWSKGHQALQIAANIWFRDTPTLVLPDGGNLYFAALYFTGYWSVVVIYILRHQAFVAWELLVLAPPAKCLQSWEESNLRRPRPRPVLIVSTNSLLLHILLFSIIAYIVNCINQFSIIAYTDYSILQGKLNFRYFCTLHCSTIGLQTQW